MYKGITAHNRKTLQLEREQRHIEKLRKLGYKYSTLMALRTVENRMNYKATQACNGEITDQEYSEAEMQASNKVAELFGGRLPKGFFINGDPRGYALKCEGNDKISFTDWGSYQILAPDRSNF